MSDRPLSLSRAHRSRLMQIWRSAGWPCRDALEVDLIAAGLVALSCSDEGRETLRLSGAGFQCLADSRLQNRHALTAHAALQQRVARHLVAAGRWVWLELSLRAIANGPQLAAPALQTAEEMGLWPELVEPLSPAEKAVWRLSRPDVFSVRNTSVEHYLHPVVHEVKVSRADLLSDLRNPAKRQAYQWLCCECYFVFPEGLAEPDEIPEAFGIWVSRGDAETGSLEMLRPARHTACRLPFAVWMALAKSMPWGGQEETADAEPLQGLLGADSGPAPDHPAVSA